MKMFINCDIMNQIKLFSSSDEILFTLHSLLFGMFTENSSGILVYIHQPLPGILRLINNDE